MIWDVWIYDYLKTLNMTKAEMQDRLIDFAVAVSDVVDLLPQKRYAKYLGGQLERSGTSPALNYGEASAAESIKDLLHKDKIIPKELQETFVGLKIISQNNHQFPKSSSSPVSYIFI